MVFIGYCLPTIDTCYSLPFGNYIHEENYIRWKVYTQFYIDFYLKNGSDNVVAETFTVAVLCAFELNEQRNKDLRVHANGIRVPDSPSHNVYKLVPACILSSIWAHLPMRGINFPTYYYFSVRRSMRIGWALKSAIVEYHFTSTSCQSIPDETMLMGPQPVPARCIGIILEKILYIP